MQNTYIHEILLNVQNHVILNIQNYNIINKWHSLNSRITGMGRS